MRMLIILILLLISLYGEGQIINASPAYRRVASSSCSNLLLDNYGANNYGGFALFKAKCSYTGYSIRVRRSSDNAEQDIGFLESGELDTTSLKTFVGSGNGYVTKMYNQNGTSNAVQTTASKQPLIVNSGVIYRLSSKPSLYWDGTNQYLVFENTNSKSRLDIFYVHSTSDAFYVQFITETNEEVAWGYLAVNNANTTYRQGIPNSSLYVNNSLISVSTRGDAWNALNGTKVITLQYFATGTGVNLKFTNYSTAGIYFTGYASCFLIYDGDASANRSNINDALNSYYSIY